MKDLEVKVDDLEKASEAANHENGLLRAQVERLQTELKEYRKRLSVNPSANRYSPQNSSTNLSSKSQWDINNNFQFAFPRFDFGLNSPAPNRNNSGSPTTANSNVNYTGRQTNAPIEPSSATFSNGMEELNGLFSPSILASASSNSEKDYINISPASTAVKSPTINSAHSRISETVGSDVNSNSPCSSANNGFTSSCVTTPEYSADSPEQRKMGETATNVGVSEADQRNNSVSHDEFCNEFSKACGNKSNPVPPLLNKEAGQLSHTPVSTKGSSIQPETPLAEAQSFDWFATQNGGSFDPVLFADYRDPQENIMNGDFGGFFQDAYGFNDFSEVHAAPLETNLPKKRDLIKEIEEQQADKETEVVPGENPKQFLTCNMLW